MTEVCSCNHCNYVLKEECWTPTQKLKRAQIQIPIQIRLGLMRLLSVGCAAQPMMTQRALHLQELRLPARAGRALVICVPARQSPLASAITTITTTATTTTTSCLISSTSFEKRRLHAQKSCSKIAAVVSFNCKKTNEKEVKS